MAGQGPQRGTSLRLRLGIVGVMLAGIGALSAVWQSVSEAGAPPFKPHVVAQFKEDKLQLVVTLPGEGKVVTGPLVVELTGVEPGQGQRKNLERADPLSSQVFTFTADKAQADKLTVNVAFGGRKASVPVAKVVLLKGHETSLVSGAEFHAGSKTSILCTVHGVHSLTESIGLPGSSVAVLLRDKAGKETRLYDGKTDAAGLANLDFEIPNLEPGQYTLEVKTQSAFGEEKLERGVQLKADTKILLVSDKPIYQPGQLMHIRALVLRPFDMKPLEKKELAFEVEDAKGNKVFKKTLQTSEFGVASVDFQLADEVNMGDYHLRAALGDAHADKTVAVKRYVLPKFKAEVKADKTFYLPKETVKVELQSDYFFGKPVANAKVEVEASTFDVAFRKFQTWKGTTDANGHAKFEVVLPDYFVGQPLQQGNAIVKLEVKILDSADHTETIVKSYNVSEEPIRVSLIAEGGKLAPDMDSRIFVAAVYPDGSAAPNTTVKLWHTKLPDAAQPGFRGGRGRPFAPALPPAVPGAPPAPAAEAKAEKKAVDLGEPLATLKTNAAGLAEFVVRVKADQIRTAGFGQNDVEFLGGKQQTFGPKLVYDLRGEARDAKGNMATVIAEVNSQPMGENVLLRLDRAVYQTGQRMDIDVRTSAGLPTVYLDLVRGGQIMLSRWLAVEKGKAHQTLDLPPEVFGSLEVHAYQMLSTGEVIRDSRVVYVQGQNDLKIDVTPSKAEFEPGENGRIRFKVSDSQGRPTQAALGVIVVDEAVYALQDLQPGLEKVYFTLQEELLKPQAQIKTDTIDNIVRLPVIPAPRQQVAEVLLNGVKLPAPPMWNVNPGLQRAQQAENQLQFVGGQVFNYAANLSSPIAWDKDAKKYAFKKTLLDEMAKANYLQPQQLQGLFGDSKTILNDLAHIEKGFTASNLAKAITAQRIQIINNTLIHYTNANKAKFEAKGVWTLPATVLQDAVAGQRLDGRYLKDGWDQPLQLVYREKKVEHAINAPQLDHYDIVSPGPDGKLGTADDVVSADSLKLAREGWIGAYWWAPESRARMMRQQPAQFGMMGGRGGPMRREMAENRMRAADGFAPQVPGAAPAAAGLGGPGAPADDLDRLAAKGDKMLEAEGVSGAPGGGAGAAPTRVRDYFPETMLWQPALITDEKGIADLSVNFADSITTWRLSASANSRGGALGGAMVPLKVFQDFFVDIDLPVSLTQTDEVAFPVAVYNYLKTPQTVRIELQAEPWFELVDAGGLVRKLDLAANEVTSVKYRIRANKIGMQPLTVKAFGSKKSDAVKRSVDVVPNGQKFEKVVSDRLNGNINQTIEIPANAVADASKLMVRIYPGAMAQVVEGLDGMMRMPGGCFEQTSSSAFPNILIVDYIKKNRIASPEMLMKAEQFLNVGYQRLLTFERPGGGFDWWGREEPLVWLSAYGLQEFSDMAKVYPIDRGIIDRTQQFLMKKADPDGTWSNIGATHGETIASMGNPKLLLTSYVTWSLLDSGMPKDQLKKSVDYIRGNLNAADNNPYILALAANALAAFDAKDDSTLEAIQKLEKLHKDLPEWKATHFPTNGRMSLAYSHGDSVSVESTALAAIAMIRTGQFTNSVNQSLTYLVKSKQGNGTWGSTQATILSLKALLAGMGGAAPKEPVHFAIKVNGKEAARGKVDAENVDMLQAFDLKDFKVGANEIAIDVGGETNLLYQIVGRHYEPWKEKVEAKKPAIDLDVTYDRTKLSTNDLLKAKATLKYNGTTPTYMVMLDLGIAPGFTVDAGDFAEMVDKGRIKKFSVTSRQVIVYLGDVKPGDELTFEYSLRPRYPLRARTAPSVAYEYNTPAVRVEARPVELVVEERK